jgi:sporulation protein YlmC with PRC-barrel domain
MIEISKLKGKIVITEDSFHVGEISEAIMDDNWKITFIHVKLTKEATDELGFQKPIFGHIIISLPISYIKGLGDVITLNKKRLELDKIPEFIIE